MLEPGVYAAPPGADFPAALVAALGEWGDAHPAEALARVTLYVNTRRMQRRVRALFDAGPPRLLPRLKLVTDIGRDLAAADLPPAVPPLRRRLELAQLVARLVELSPDLAPRAAVFDLADSLARLMDEMQGEGVGIDAIRNLDVTDISGHWARSQTFLTLVGDYLAADGTRAPDPEARLRLATERLIARWTRTPPADPVIVAGSTGSRDTTAMLMAAVAALPTGILLLPGYDADMTPADWDRVREAGEDHPQYRFAALLDRIGLPPDAVRPWPGATAPDPARNRLLSLSLRPAPVTDQWLRDGPALGDLRAATKGMTLLQAPGPREEASAIALILRNAAETGQRAALVSPDRMLTRRVTALLDRWGIEPDDSAGRPLALSPPGRFLRQVSALRTQTLTAGDLLALLKHPLTHTGQDRGPHLQHTHELELWMRRHGTPYPDAAALSAWAKDREARKQWADWLRTHLPDPASGALPVSEHVAALLGTAEALTAGPEAEGAGELWNKPAGRKAREVMDGLTREADAGGTLTATEFDTLLYTLLEGEEVRDPDAPHPGVMIWGTMEARVQGADLVILGALNEGSWPEPPAPDPWLNRRMRAEAGLLSPERQIGLSAHDYQQAAAAPEVVLSRALKEADAEPVQSRWLNRLTNLLGGLAENAGPEALADMQRRGARWVAMAKALETPEAPEPPAPRPAPRPPVEARPKGLSVTSIQRLIRDPYAIYAQYVLGLRAISPLNPGPDAPLRGQVLHRIFDGFTSGEALRPSPDPKARLLAITDEVLAREAPWPMARRLWRERIARVADWFLDLEANRGSTAQFLTAELKGTMTLPEIGFTLSGTADRLDRVDGGGIAVLDYKTGTPPSAPTMEHFDKQLLLEALIAEAGGFPDIPPAPVAYVAHVGLGAKPQYAEHRLEDTDKTSFALPGVRAGLVRLIAAYGDRSQGYTSRRAMQKVGFDGDYDHLARFGEWDETAAPEPEDVG